ncbi:MAG TPA: 6-hydroxymethylpterin diphosphokinase MptE-like protein [Rhabdochlamydiaceae bacterium]|nr:6-hydroxymethylpterin diphosphokinase MptE-like protein [Rhabdochlamydiaceae bacterium]
MLKLLQERFPEIAFALTFTSFTHIPSPLQDNLELRSSIEEIEVLYLFGVGNYFKPLKEWLTRKGRLLIILEDDLARIDAFLKTEDAALFLDCPNLVLKYVQNWETVLEELPIEYSTDRVEVAATTSYQKKRASFFKKIQLKLYRNHASIAALLSEVLYSHKLFANLYPNLLKLPISFFANRFKGMFKDIPALICGAGPSLQKDIESLRQMEQEALIFAGGSAITAFGRHQLRPHFCMALDPNQEEYERLKEASSFETPFLYAARVQKDLFQTCNGPFGYMKSDTGGLAEEWFEKRLPIEGTAIGPELGREAFSVTTLAIAFAYELGCNPIILSGVDLAFTGMQRYASGIVEKNSAKQLDHDARITDKRVMRKDRQGKKVQTLIKWIMESDCISAFAKAHPERTFINATEGGIGFSKIPYLPLEEVRKKYCTNSYDLHGKIHAQIQKSGFPKDLEEKLDAASEELAASLGRCLKLCEQMVQELKKCGDSYKESGKMVVLQMDLKEESAFECFLQPLEFALQRLFARYFFDSPLERKRAEWEQMQIMVRSFLRSLSTPKVCSSASVS